MYLGGVDFQGKRVLELGTANGFLCFQMEQRGAQVTGYDLNPDFHWDVIPYDEEDVEALTREKSRIIRQLNNAYWFAHERIGSSARVVYGSIYDVPAEIGPVDIATFGCILLHLRDPFRALAAALPLARETVIVTDVLPTDERYHDYPRNEPVAPDQVNGLPVMAFLPDYRNNRNPYAWWVLYPEIIMQWIGVLGFDATHILFHRQRFRDEYRNLYTVVGHRRS
jgi:SAM-dependent methyltransferase